MAEIVETGHAGAFILTEANGKRSRANVTVMLGEVLAAGSVLSRGAPGAGSASAAAGNVGNGAFGAVTVGEGALPGAYRVTFIEPAAAAGEFTVSDPEGVEIGTGTVGVAFNAGGVGFTIADGATDFAAGDAFVIDVAEGTNTVRAYDPGDGVGAVGVIIYDTDATDGPVDVAAIVRDAEVNVHELVFEDAITEDEIAAAIDQLAVIGILAR